MRIIYGLLAFIMILFVACSQQSDKANEKAPSSTGISSQKPIRVVTTIGMITDIVQNVGGDRVNATGLMGPGIDPHLYRASEGDVARLAGADLILYNGLHLEGKMAGVLERMQDQIKTVAVTQDVDRAVLLAPPEFEGAYDPHLWFDVTLWMKTVERVRDTLIEVDKGSAELYRANTKNYLAKLVELHNYVMQQAKRISPDQRVLVTAHDAFNYFGRAYGFEVRGLQGISTATEAGTADVQALVQFIVERRIPAMFVETSVPRQSIEAVQAAVKAKGFSVEIGGQLFSDAMGASGTPEGTYIGMVRHNIDTIVASLLQTVAN
ncbi:manganese transporter [Candidatus Poribacteria bacterium]|nr:manganese transporter [Candidatus Poribacteria bacterium]